MTDVQSQAETKRAVERCLADLPDALDPGAVAFGFDGFVDRVRRMVDERHDADAYDSIATLEDLGERISQSAAADSSLSIEWLQTDVRTGGHVAHLSRAYANFGYNPVMLGTFGEPPVDPFRAEFPADALTSFGDPGYTDAVEFRDGKLMLLEIDAPRSLDWEQITAQCPPEKLAASIDGVDLLGLGYFADMPELPGIADGLRTEVWPLLEDPPGTLLVDPGDVRKLQADTLHEGIGSFTALDDLAPVTVSANRYETTVLADRLGDGAGDSLAAATAAAYDALDVTRFVGHGVDVSVATSAAGQTTVDVPTVEDPEMTTSAGDHFNVGLSLGLLHDLDDGAAVALGNAVASYFVRTGDQPDYDELRTSLQEYAQSLD
jgi:hypothetical protein